MLLCTLCFCPLAISLELSISNTTYLGPLHSPDVTGLSRDGGASVLLDGRIIWIFDDTECLSETGQQIGFVSNSASYNLDPNGNITNLQDFGIVKAGKNGRSQYEYAIRAGGNAGKGGWIPFKHPDLEFNEKLPGKARIAICEFIELSGSSKELTKRE